MLERSGGWVPAAWVTADEVYGGDRALRVWLEDHSRSYVLAVKGTEPLVMATQESTTGRQPAGE